MRRQTTVHLYAFGTVLLWGTAFSCTKFVLHFFSADVIGLLRYLIASAVLLPPILLQKGKLPPWKDIPLFFASGAMGIAVYMVVFNKGLESISAATSSILIATAPIFTALLAMFLFKERLKALSWVSIAIEFGGILVLTLWNGVLSINTGIFWTLSAALLISGYNLLQRRFLHTYTALQATAYSIFAGTILLLVFLPEAIPQVLATPPLPLLAVVFLGIFPSAIGYVLWSKAFSVAERTSTVTNYMFLTPFLSTLFGFFLLREQPGFSVLVGGAIILAGLALFRLAEQRKAAG